MTRLISCFWNVITCAIAACPLVLLVAPPAYAYIDPSVMTYTIQAVAGVAVALSAVLGVALRRTRKVIFRVFKIDENAKKVVEAPVVAIDAASPNATAQRLEAEESAKQAVQFLDRGPEPKLLNWSQRFMRALLCCAFLIFTVFIMGPLEIVAGSDDSLIFNYVDAAPYVITIGVIAILVAALALAFVRGRAFDVVMALIVGLALCAYIQAIFLNESLPVADGNGLILTDHMVITIVSTLVWLAIIIGSLVLARKKVQVCRVLALALSACLILIQGVSLASITIDEQAKAASGDARIIQTTAGLNEVSANENVIVFVLDFFDTRVLEDILADDPQTLSEFTGFTYFRNSVGSMIPTAYAVPYLLTGELPQDGDSYESYIAERYERSSFLDEIAEEGYDIGIYSDSVRSSAPALLASNYVAAESLDINVPVLIASLDKVALYRDLPWILKPFFWFYTDEVNRSALNEEQSPYLMDDIQYAQDLRANGLELNSNDKSFRFIHLLGAHYPFIMDANGYATKGLSDVETQGHGSLVIVSDYLRELKRLGLYDNATIIITSDHGDFYLTDQSINEPVSPILLVKPAETAAEAAMPLKVSDVPTGHLDFHATIIDAVNGNGAEYGTPIFEVPDAPRTRYYWMTGNDGTNSIFWRQFEINGHVLDFDSWTLTGKEIKIP